MKRARWEAKAVRMALASAPASTLLKSGHWFDN